MRKIFYFIIFIIISIVGCNNQPKQEIIDNTVKNDTLIEVEVKPIIKDSLLYELAQLSNDSSLQNASISYIIVDDSSKTVIAEHNSNVSLVPASTMKIVTTAAAFGILGGGKHFKTSIQTTGTIVQGILKGNIYIKGGGDPALGSKYFKNSNAGFIGKWASQIAAMGIDSIDGAVIGDAQIFDTDFIPPTWEWGEIGSEYGTGASGLSVYDNRFKMNISKNTKGRYHVSRSNITPFLPNLYFENHLKSAAVKKDIIYFLGDPFSDYRVIKGIVRKGVNSLKAEGAIPDPAYLVAYQLESKLIALGIALSDSATTVRKLKSHGKNIETRRNEVCSSFSPSVGSIINVTNSSSNNLYAEHLLMHIGLKQHHEGSTHSGAEAIKEYWKNKGIDVTGMYIGDGSGISRHNAISVKHLTDILCFMKDSSENYDKFYNSLSVAGKSGTLRKLCKQTLAENNLRAKSGSMTRVKSYAGYVTNKAGKNLTFAIIINNYNCKSTEVKEKIERIMIRMAAS